MCLPHPPCPVQVLPPREVHDAALSQPPSQGLVVERNSVALGQFLGCQRRSKIPIPEERKSEFTVDSVRSDLVCDNFKEFNFEY